MADAAIDIGGPDNITPVELAELVADVCGKRNQVKHVPLIAMRVAALILGPIRPDVARLIRTLIAMDTTDMTFDASRSGPCGTQPTSVKECVVQGLADQS